MSPSILWLTTAGALLYFFGLIFVVLGLRLNGETRTVPWFFKLLPMIGYLREIKKNGVTEVGLSMGFAGVIFFVFAFIGSIF